jgi:uncharacterized protein
MKHFIQKSLLIVTLTVLSMGSALAMDLNEAKKSGLIGEMQNGLVETTLPTPSAGLDELVAKTNEGRMEVYKDMANKQNIPLKEIQAIAAQKLYDMAEEGSYLMIDGKWKKK